jgi:hypothetical protein
MIFRTGAVTVETQAGMKRDVHFTARAPMMLRENKTPPAKRRRTAAEEGIRYLPELG